MANEKPKKKKKQKAEPLFSPELAPDVRTLLAANQKILVPASAPAPKRHIDLRDATGTSIAGLGFFAAMEYGVWLFVRWLAYGLFPDAVAPWISGGAGILGLLLLVAMLIGMSIESKERTAARVHHGEYLLPADWDADATALMLRAQQAVRSVQESDVNQRGLLDAVKNEIVLPENLWDLGRVLQQQSALRVRQTELAEQLPGAQLEAVLAPQRQAIELSATAMEAKVAKLEQYAEQVREADAVLRAESILASALEDRDRYVELLSSTEIAGHSDLIDELSKETADLRAVLNRSITAALETGQTLALPDDHA
ncbi:hypothetical protein AB0L70_23090 [Kribbella sp. NPDC051952]|uniref:hypothetical protein n=1 Tax=Kribbella sp. NPDC051952 TaxID=3154851 RepID=UPI00342E6472